MRLFESKNSQEWSEIGKQAAQAKEVYCQRLSLLSRMAEHLDKSLRYMTKVIAHVS